MTWIPTYSGRRVHPLDLRPEDIEVIDIGHALGNLCRFNGQCTAFYSVAQHSALVASILPGPLALCGLLHDAAEAYLADIVTPVKRQLRGYAEAENRAWRAIADRFGLPYTMPARVGAADLVLLATERRDLVVPDHGDHEWPHIAGVEPMPERIHPLPPAEAKTQWLMLFDELARAEGVA